MAHELQRYAACIVLSWLLLVAYNAVCNLESAMLGIEMNYFEPIYRISLHGYPHSRNRATGRFEALCCSRCKLATWVDLKHSAHIHMHKWGIPDWYPKNQLYHFNQSLHMKPTPYESKWVKTGTQPWFDIYYMRYQHKNPQNNYANW